MKEKEFKKIKEERSKFKVYGKVLEKETGKGIPNLIVKAVDKDLLFDDILGEVTTDENGYFEIKYNREDFKGLLLDKEPDIYLNIRNANGDVIYTTETKVVYDALEEEEFVIRISKSLIKGKKEDWSILREVNQPIKQIIYFK